MQISELHSYRTCLKIAYYKNSSTDTHTQHKYIFVLRAQLCTLVYVCVCPENAYFNCGKFVTTPASVS